MGVGDGGTGKGFGTSLGSIHGERETGSGENFIDSKMEYFGPGARAFPDFLASIFPESLDARAAGRRLIGWAISFVEMDKDWPILEIRSTNSESVRNLSIGFDKKRDTINVRGPYLELKLPLSVFRRVSVDNDQHFLGLGSIVEFYSSETHGYEEKLTIFAGGDVVYSRDAVTTVE